MTQPQAARAPAPLPAGPGRPQPLYREIMARLQADIVEGRFAVGDRFPTEQALCERFGASRQTVRAALRHLQADGLIQRRQGSGSVVAAALPQPRFESSIGSLDELMQYAQSTWLEVLALDRVAVPADLAPRLDCPAGAPWIRVVALRRAAGEALPLAHTTIYVPERFADAAALIGTARMAVCQIIARRHGLQLSAVRQSIEAAAVAAEVAPLLGLDAGDPVLRIDRRYEAGADGLIEMAFNQHPPGRFSYGLTLRQAG
ncbi:MAG: GntR family transcriptional regulator [Sneathiellaceae bacterium]